MGWMSQMWSLLSRSCWPRGGGGSTPACSGERLGRQARNSGEGVISGELALWPGICSHGDTQLHWTAEKELGALKAISQCNLPAGLGGTAGGGKPWRDMTEPCFKGICWCLLRAPGPASGRM